MESHDLRYRTTRRGLPTTPRELLAVVYRHKRGMILSFIFVFVFSILAILFLPIIKYKSELDILVKHERVDPVVTTAANSLGQYAQDTVSKEDMNSETQLIQSMDLLEETVVASGLHLVTHWYTAWIPHFSFQQDTRIAKAVDKLASDIDAEWLTDSNVVTVTYQNPDAEMAARVLRELSRVYLNRHMELHNSPGENEFFMQQRDAFKTSLHGAQARLADFSRTQGAVDATVERESALSQLSTFNAALNTTKATIAQTQARIKADEALIKTTPQRLDTQKKNADNSQLLSTLKATLVNLQLKRTDLLTKFDPSYPPVKEVETEIAQAQAALSAEDQKPVREDTTDQNPTYQWVVEDLAQAKSALPGLEAQAASQEDTVRNYRTQAIFYDQKAWQQKNLLIGEKSAETNYLLYFNKREESRIASALNRNRIVNVVVQAAPIVPGLPAHSPWLFVACALILAIGVSIGYALVKDYFDESFRTPDEVKDLLDIPVLAAIPRNGF